MEFLGRQDELKILQDEYERDSGFVVLYGRRRVGKTTLIREFIKNKNALYYLATEEMEQLSINKLTKLVADFIGKPNLKNATFHDWRDLFEEIADYKPAEKKVIVIDELPYLVKNNEAFPSILQYVWDELLKDKNVMLILCGSYVSMMEKYALYYASPLYGRRTAQIRLQPLSFHVASHSADFENACEQYAITGGVPKYIEFFDGKNTKEVIESVILSKSGFLYNEPSFLLKEEVREPLTYFSIIETIAKSNHKLSKIASVLETPATSISPYLSTLIELGFIEKRVPITEENIGKSKKGLFYIADNFMRFWFKYVYPFKGQLELDIKEVSLKEIENDFISNFVAKTYEDICKQIFLAETKHDFATCKIGSYWNNGEDEIDVAAIDDYNRKAFFGECKYNTQPVAASIYFDLKSKVENSKELQQTYKGYEFFYGVFSKSGFSPHLTELAAGNAEITLFDKYGIIR
ncbi:MAG: ATP-binding protein [Clostridiales Family XIII bacterium]|jgi:AAA+ ATPase superfamily predicted ATPase|nr:ATP-binding protein [Clostridiales Family XIII bacterium]